MTDEVEKARLRAKKRHREMLKVLERRGALQEAVQSMVHRFHRLFREHDTFVDAISGDTARMQDRVDIVLEGIDDQAAEADDSLRDVRAAEIVQQYREAEQASVDGQTEAASPREAMSDAPEKTIGRMRTPRSTSE